MTLRETVSISFCLCKARISLFASLSAATGFALAAGRGAVSFCALCAGVFLLACGACALNQYQARDVDARMARTARRPLPSGKIRPGYALTIAGFLILCGEGLLLFAQTAIVPILGLAALLWYNGVYTGLKKRSAFAVVPGALVGSIPPAMGWTAGGGQLSDPALFALVFFFFLWQVPHFWLHLLSYGKEYAVAGLRSLTEIFSEDQLKRLTFQWVSATAVSALLLGLCGPLHSAVAKLGLRAAALWLVGGAVCLMVRQEEIHERLFARINVFMFVVMMIAFWDRGAGWMA